MPSRVSAKATASATPASSSTTRARATSTTRGTTPRQGPLFLRTLSFAAPPRLPTARLRSGRRRFALNAESLSVEHVPAPPIAPAPVLSQPRSHASALLETSEHSTWADEARRLATAASLAAVFGVALGLRHGGLSLASGAAGAPLGILAVGALAAPALVILLALANAPIDALDLGR